MPSAKEVSQWLPEGGGDYDIVVVGTQENAFKDQTPQSGSATSEVAIIADVAIDIDDDEKIETMTPEAVNTTHHPDSAEKQPKPRCGCAWE